MNYIQKKKKATNNIFHIIFMCSLAMGFTSTSLSIIPYSSILYIISFAAFIILELYTIQGSNIKIGNNSIFYFMLIIVTFITNSINQIFDYRYLFFLIILILTGPIIQSNKLFLLKKGIIKYILYIFMIITLICFICYCIGYNGPIDHNTSYNPLDFKGITNHPMWLAPICGSTNIVCLYYITYSKNKTFQVLFFLMFCISIYTSVAAASRSSLLASIITLFFFIYIKYNKIATVFKFIMIAIILGSISFQFLDTRRIENKMEFQKESKTTSRDGLWKKRIIEINDSPILGVGFATSGTGYNKKVGRMESGGGWISILSQTGILGLTIILIITLRIFRRIMVIRRKKIFILYASILCFLCIHSFFEGYIYTPGYNLCLLFWLLIGFLTEASNRYFKRQSN